MTITSEQRADAIRDLLALTIAILDYDGEAVDAILAANRGDMWPLVSTAVAMIIPVVAASGQDVRAWVAAMREQERRAPR